MLFAQVTPPDAGTTETIPANLIDIFYIMAIILMALSALYIIFLGVHGIRNAIHKRAPNRSLPLAASVFLSFLFSLFGAAERFSKIENVASFFNVIFKCVGVTIKSFAADISDDITGFFQKCIQSATTSQARVFNALSIIYNFIPFICLLVLSLTVVSFFFKTANPKFHNFVRWFFIRIKQFIINLIPDKAFVKIAHHEKIIRQKVYIFTDTNVSMARAVGRELKSPKIIDGYDGKKHRIGGDIVTMVIPSAILRTQEGTEFKDSLILDGFDVITENSSYRYLKFISRRTLTPLTKKVIYCFKKSDTDNNAFAKKAFDIIYKDERRSFSIKGKKRTDEQVKEDSTEKYLKSSLLFTKLMWRHKKHIIRIKKLTSLLKKGNDAKICAKLKKEYKRLESLQFYIGYNNDSFSDLFPYIKQSFGVIKPFSEYDIVATDFAMNNPIHMFIDNFNERITKNTSEFGPMNVHFFGFGKINQAIFGKLSSAYQLNGDEDRLVHYHIVDINSNNAKAEIDKKYKACEKKCLSKPFESNKAIENINEELKKKYSVYLTKSDLENAITNKLEGNLSTTLDYIDGNPGVINKDNAKIGAYYAALTEMVNKENENLKEGKIEAFLNCPKMFDISAEMDGCDMESEKNVSDYIDALFSTKTSDEQEVSEFNVNKVDNSEFNLFIVSMGNIALNIKVAGLIKAALERHESECNNKYFIYVYCNSISDLKSHSLKYTPMHDADEQREVVSSEKHEFAPIFMFGDRGILRHYAKTLGNSFDEFGMWANHYYGNPNNVSTVKYNANYFNAKATWLNLSNKEKLKNTYVLLQMGTKFHILGKELKYVSNQLVLSDIDSSAPYQEVLITTEKANKLNEQYTSDPIRDCILKMEHNRWIVQTLTLYGNKSRSLNDFYQTVFYLDNDGKEGCIKTKSDNGALHSCLLSNSNLRGLEGMVIYHNIANEIKPDNERFNDSLKEVRKTIYDNDISSTLCANNILSNDNI